MEVISGKEIAAEIKSQIATDVEKYAKEYNIDKYMKGMI